MNLVTFLRKNKDEIAKEWIDFAMENIPLTNTMNRKEAEDHLKQLLDRIVEDMESLQTNEEQKVKSLGNKKMDSLDTIAARDHGDQRSLFGFDLLQLSSEFRALRASVLRLWAKKSREENWETDFHDMIRFNEVIDEIWIISLRRFQEKLDESKNLFLGILGHDLRNPITTIKGANSILKESQNLSEDEKETLAFSDRSVERMIELINNLLELTELRLGGGMTVDKAQLDLSSLFREMIRQQKLAFPNVDIISDINDDKVKGNWDKLRLSQMMTNLITNAIKHGKDAPVRVKLSSNSNNVHFSVHNEGHPISEDILDKIFDGRFTRSNAGTSKEKSYGLGLLIVKEIVEGHHGEIKVTSSSKEGTTFTAILPKD